MKEEICRVVSELGTVFLLQLHLIHIVPLCAQTSGALRHLTQVLLASLLAFMIPHDHGQIFRSLIII